MSKILVCIPIKPTLNPQLLNKCVTLASQLPANNPLHDFTTYLDFTPIPKVPNDYTPWSKVTRARNLMLSKTDLKQYDYLLWIDADVVSYPLDMPTRLIQGNPDGISAPMVMIEDSQTFYDWAAFIPLGKSVIEPANRNYIAGRNINPSAPYWNTEPTEKIIEVDCVGTITLVPSWIYQHASYEDHPAFTDHYPLCKACRANNRRVTVDRTIIAYHADLPRYGENWH